MTQSKIGNPKQVQYGKAESSGHFIPREPEVHDEGHEGEGKVAKGAGLHPKRQMVGQSRRRRRNRLVGALHIPRHTRVMKEHGEGATGNPPTKPLSFQAEIDVGLPSDVVLFNIRTSE